MTDPIRCPACNSPDTITYPRGDDFESKHLRLVFPDARKCVDCEYVWHGAIANEIKLGPGVVPAMDFGLPADKLR